MNKLIIYSLPHKGARNMNNNQALSAAHSSYLEEMEREPAAETWDGEPIYENEEYFDIDGENVINDIDCIRDYLNERYTLKTAERG